MKLLLFYFFFMLSVQLPAQTDEPLRFERIEGLSQNTVYSILKDKQGFLWIATADGLNRYDGVEMKVYKPGLESNNQQMRGRIIRSGLLEDEDEQIWFSTDRTLNCFNKRNGKFKHYNLLKNGSGRPVIDTILRGEMFAHPLIKFKDKLWLANATEGLFVLNTADGSSTNYPLAVKDDAGNFVPLMYNGVFDGKNKFWFASKNGLLSFDTLNKQWKEHYSGTPFYTISLYRDTLIAGSGNTIKGIDTRTFNSIEFMLYDRPESVTAGAIRRIYTDEKGNNWAGDQEGNVNCKKTGMPLFRWMGNINTNSSSLTKFPLYCFYADEEDHLWIGGDVLGLLKTDFSSTIFKKFPDTHNETITDKSLFIYSIYEDEDDKVWLGTFQNGLMILDKKTGKTQAVQLKYDGPPMIYGKLVPLIKKDSKGNLWTSSFGHMYIREKNAQSFTAVKFPVPSNALQTPQLWSLSEYKDGWVAGTNIGLYFITKTTGKYDVTYLTQVDQSKITGTWISDSNEIWVLLESRGILVLKSTDDLNLSSQKRLFPETNIKSVKLDSARRILWIATASGLIAYHLPTGQHKVYGDPEGLLNTYVLGVLLSDEEIWLSTNYGLSRSNTIYTKESVFPELRFTNFTKADGLPGNEFNTGAFYKAPSGNLYFGTTNGVVWFDPTKIKSTNQTPQLQLIGFLANEESPDSTITPEYLSSVSLPYSKNNLFLKFRGIDFTNGKKVKYMYRLEGWDKDWIYSKDLNEVRYNNLAPGNYTFKIKAANSSGQWTTDANTIRIRIIPPFWQTWWFYTICGLAIVLTIILITRYFAQQKLKIKVTELEKQKELEKARNRIEREMQEDIGAGLTQITLMTESVKNKTTGISGKELDDITSTSRKLVNNMSEIIWSLNTENKTLDQFCAYLREELNKQLEYAGMEYTVQLPEDRKDIVLTNEQRRNLLLIAKEIVNNAIKYSKAKSISVMAGVNSNRLYFEIADNGNGFDMYKTYTGNGLKNMRNRIEELGGRMELVSGPETGTVFKYTIPLAPTT